MIDVAASVRARLLNLAKQQGVDFNQILVRFALERILYRLFQAGHSDRFLLKGALLFTLWYDMPHRATRDADLLGFGSDDLQSLSRTFSDIASVTVDDGIVFDPSSVSVAEIRKEAGYSGARIIINAELAKARCRTQIDVGFGDAVTPGPVDGIYPVLLSDLPAPRLRTYPVYTVVAEKLHAISVLGMTNSRMKDYLDLEVLLSREELDLNVLEQAIIATFERRGTQIPLEFPAGLSNDFSHDPTRQALWQAFISKNELTVEPLPMIVDRIRTALSGVLDFKPTH